MSERREVAPTEIARDWYGLAQSVAKEHPFVRFIMLWISFNALYGDDYSRRHENERPERHTAGDHGQVAEFAGLPVNQQRHELWMNQAGPYSGAVRKLIAARVMDAMKRTTFEGADESKLSDILDCVYAVRCNLFHGDKVPFDHRSRDCELVEIASEVLDPLVKELLE